MTENTTICESLHETPLENKNKSNRTHTEKIDCHKKNTTSLVCKATF